MLASFLTTLAAVAAAAVTPAKNNLFAHASKLAQRDTSDMTPTECNFAGAKQDLLSVSYLDIPTPAGANPPRANNCFGWTTGTGGFCNKPWTGQEFEDIQAAVAQQAAKEGLFEITQVGAWTAEFLLPTTAFANRDTQTFAFYLDIATAGQLRGVNEAGAGSSSNCFWADGINRISVHRLGCP